MLIGDTTTTSASLLVPLVFLSLAVLLTLGGGLRQVIFEGVDDLVQELAIGGLVPPHPVTGVAGEAAAAEERGVVGFHGGASPAGMPGEVGGGGGGAGEEVGEDFPVVRRERGREGEDGRREEGELVGDERRRGVDRPFMVELFHGEEWREKVLCCVVLRCVGYSFSFLI